MPDYDFRSPRLFVDADLSDGLPVAATAVQANYLSNVMRLGEGAQILAFNGRDGEWRCALSKPAKKKIELEPIERTRAQTARPDLLYCFAPLKHARLDYMVQKAVEMGAGILQPVMTQHTQASRLNIERMRANAIEAAEQCGILAIPECRQLLKLADCLAGWESDRMLVFCDERQEDADPVALLAPLAGRKLAVLIGPEGGFSQQERLALMAIPQTVAIPLGPRILRADTAAVAALAVVQAVAGDWVRGASG